MALAFLEIENEYTRCRGYLLIFLVVIFAKVKILRFFNTS